MIPHKSTFPRKLLKRPVAERLEFFKMKKFQHRNQQQALDELIDLLLTDDDPATILVFGPTNVGKTTLLEKLTEKIIEIERPAMDENPGYIPIVTMEALKPESGNFNWKDHYQRNMRAVNEPLVEHKLLMRSPEQPGGMLVPPGSRTTYALRDHLIDALRERGTKYNLVDEAHRMLKVASYKLLIDQMDVIQGFGSLTGIKQVLFGTYDMLHFLDLSGQLNRRIETIHFPRYLYVKDDLKEFYDMLGSFQAALPLPMQPDLMSFKDFFYDWSWGSVGQLKKWLYRTLRQALQRNPKITTLERKDFEKTAIPLRKLDKIIAEINAGEDNLINWDENALRARVRRLPGEPLPENETVSEPATKATKKQGHRPGRRAPTRDPVGSKDNGIF